MPGPAVFAARRCTIPSWILACRRPVRRISSRIRTTVKFFGTQTAREIVTEYGKADLLLGNNVLAHVPNLNDFVAGMKLALKPGGMITMEFPHLMRLVDENQFDTIYH